MREDVVTLLDGRLVETLEVGDRSGPAVILFGGTPSTRGSAEFLRRPAEQSGVRVIGISRPGYCGSTWTTPGFASMAADAAQVADHYRIDRLAVLGMSGGGPFAAGTAAVLGDRVNALGLAAAVSGWLNDPDRPGDRVFDQWAAVANGGDEPAAVRGICDPFAAWLDPLLDKSDGDLTAEFDDPQDADLYTPSSAASSPRSCERRRTATTATRSTASLTEPGTSISARSWPARCSGMAATTIRRRWAMPSGISNVSPTLN